MHIKAKSLHFFYAKKLKIVLNQDKSLWCILKDGSKLKKKIQGERLNLQKIFRSPFITPILFLFLPKEYPSPPGPTPMNIGQKNKHMYM